MRSRLPEFGGDTLFASQAAAYDALSAGLKATLEGLSAVHSAAASIRPGPSAQKRGSMQVAEADGYVGEFVHPMVLVHPETGRKALYVNPAFTLRIDGWKTRSPRRSWTTSSSTAATRPSPAASTGQRLGRLLGQPLGLALRAQRLSRPAPHMRRVTVDPWPAWRTYRRLRNSLPKYS
jgi:taurine dioxygenase